MNTSPSLPVEILEEIISAAWMSSLTAPERITLMTSSRLVNKTWMDVFARISSTDVHIPCPSYVHQFLRLLCDPLYDAQTWFYLRRLCRSINIVVDNPATPSISGDKVLPMGEALGNLLYALHAMKGYPAQLRRLSIQYVDCGFDDISHNWRLIYCPEQITTLEISYSFDPKVPSGLIEGLRAAPAFAEMSLPTIRTLALHGASTNMVASMVEACPKLQTVDTDVSLPKEVSEKISHAITCTSTKGG